MHLYGVDQQLFDQRCGGRKIALVLRDHVGEGRLFAEWLDVVAGRMNDHLSRDVLN
jgi:hypothetical protein